jgi:hypothetical protein
MDQLTLFAGDFPAKTSHLQDEELDSQENAQVSGGNTTGSSKSFSRNGSSQRTSQPFALEDWTKSSGHSLRSGMMRNGTVFPLPTLVPGINGTESGFLPTPTASTHKGAPKNRFYGSPTYRSNLHEALRNGPNDPIYPSPAFCEALMGFPAGHTDLNS